MSWKNNQPAWCGGFQTLFHESAFRKVTKEDQCGETLALLHIDQHNFYLFCILGFHMRFYLKNAASWSPAHRSLETCGVIQRALLQEV